VVDDTWETGKSEVVIRMGSNQRRNIISHIDELLVYEMMGKKEVARNPFSGGLGLPS